MEIGSFVRKIRRERKLSQSQLAEKAGVGLNFVYQMEKNKPTVQLNCASQVLEALGFKLSVERIVTDTRPGAWVKLPRSFELPWD